MKHQETHLHPNIEIPQFIYSHKINSNWLANVKVKIINLTSCRKVDWVGTRNCFWTRHINNFDQEYFQHHCGWNRVVVGFESEHIDRFEDRRWKLRCCPVSL